jgi:hypothetical protein
VPEGRCGRQESARTLLATGTTLILARRRVVESAWSAVPGLLSVRFSRPLAEPADHQQDLREHHPAVLAVERGHRVLVALTDPA